MKITYSIVTFFNVCFLFFSLAGCTSDDSSKAQIQAPPRTSNAEKNLNLSVFLDLSDRIDPKKYPNQTMEIYKRDLGYINTLGEVFQDHLNQTRISSMDESMQLFFEPEPNSSEINELANKMKLTFNKNTVTPEKIKAVTSTYASCSSKIYNLALKQGAFVGSDIWTFFKNKVKDQCIKPKHKNVLVILTDGYMFHRDNQLQVGKKTTYLTPELITKEKLNAVDFARIMEANKIGFLEATQDLKDLKVLVIGINPQKGRNFEEDVVKKYWSTWLESMGVKEYQLKGTDLPTYMNTIIRDFISG